MRAADLSAAKLGQPYKHDCCEQTTLLLDDSAMRLPDAMGMHHHDGYCCSAASGAHGVPAAWSILCVSHCCEYMLLRN